MLFSVVGSGSKGNSVYIESNGTAVLIDAGFSGKELEKRLGIIGKSFERVQGLCVTHEHNDHISGAGVISRRYKIPVFANHGTFTASAKRIGKVHKRVEFETGDVMEIGGLQIRSFRVSHDTADPVGFVVSDGSKSVGYCTDTGKVSHLIAQRLVGCNGLILEFNHNPEMLKSGPYPLYLQQRVRSSMGHLSNEDAAQFLAALVTDSLKHVVLAHLSETNNTPELAAKAANTFVKDWNGAEMHIARQDLPLGIIEL